MLKNVLKIFKKDSFIRRKILLFASFFVIAGFYGCDTCNPGEGEIKDANDIFFSALSLNGSTPSIYAVSPNGNNLREIVKDGVIYGGPSRVKKFVFLREKSGIDTVLYIATTDGSDSISRATFSDIYKQLTVPVISPDGKYVSFYIGNGEVRIIANLSFQQTATTYFYEGTEQSFSPDGKYLAFYEKDGIFGPIHIKVVSSDHPTEEIYYNRQFETLLKPIPGNATIDWSDDSRLIAYSCGDSEKTTDIIYIKDVFGNNDYELKVKGIGAFMPSISPDDSSVAFAARDGNIWVRKIDEEKFFQITKVDSTIEYNLYPQWTNDGKEIFYLKYYRDDAGKFGGSLEIINVQTRRVMVLSNNVFRGYKMRIKA
ncbi:MAG: hypothetical protein EPN82_09610 [Bacteroidetes bacterium]|nr:MAG: hypothetical protein EPN82_09610 [Bacteroidota bacterium]